MEIAERNDSKKKKLVSYNKRKRHKDISCKERNIWAILRISDIKPNSHAYINSLQWYTIYNPNK